MILAICKKIATLIHTKTIEKPIDSSAILIKSLENI